MARAHRPERATGWLAAFVTVGALALPAGCDRDTQGETPPADHSPEPGAETYVAAIAEVLDVTEPRPDEIPDPLPVVYVVPLDGSMDIEEQAFAIDWFSTSHDMRFVDDLGAAIQAEKPGQPPRDDAILLGVGPIDPNPPHLLRIEQYHTQIDVDATLLALAFVVDQWVVLTAEPVPAEALTDVD